MHFFLNYYLWINLPHPKIYQEREHVVFLLFPEQTGSSQSAGGAGKFIRLFCRFQEPGLQHWFKRVTQIKIGAVIRLASSKCSTPMLHGPTLASLLLRRGACGACFWWIETLKISVPWDGEILHWEYRYWKVRRRLPQGDKANTIDFGAFLWTISGFFTRDEPGDTTPCPQNIWNVRGRSWEWAEIDHELLLLGEWTLACFSWLEEQHVTLLLLDKGTISLYWYWTESGPTLMGRRIAIVLSLWDTGAIASWLSFPSAIILPDPPPDSPTHWHHPPPPRCHGDMASATIMAFLVCPFGCPPPSPTCIWPGNTISCK